MGPWEDSALERLDTLIWRFLLDIQVEIFSGQLGFRKRVKAGNINLGVISIWTVFKALGLDKI